MREHELNNEEFILDEIESIELVGDEETVDICVEDTHMFYCNDIYTHNSSISSELVTTDQMGGEIKKAQVAHFIFSVAKTLTQKENGTASIGVLKSRIGKDGLVYENCTFDNDNLIINTDEQELTMYEFENNKEQKKQKKAQEILKNTNEKVKEKHSDKMIS